MTPSVRPPWASLRPPEHGPFVTGPWSGSRDYARPAPATQRTYRYAVEKIVDDVGDTLLSRVDRPTARRLASQWPKNTTRVARTMFGDAQRDGLIASNPFTNLRLETPKGRKDLQALTEPASSTRAAASAFRKAPCRTTSARLGSAGPAATRSSSTNSGTRARRCSWSAACRPTSSRTSSATPTAARSSNVANSPCKAADFIARCTRRLHQKAAQIERLSCLRERVSRVSA